MKKLILLFLITILFISCSTNVSLKNLELLLSKVGLNEKIITGDELVKNFAYLKNEIGIAKPIFLDNELIGEISLLTSSQYYAILNRKYNTGQITYEDYSNKILDFYNNKDSSYLTFLITISSKNEDYTILENWAAKLTINSEEYAPFTINKEYSDDDDYVLQYKVETITTNSKNRYYKLNTSINIEKVPIENRPKKLIPLSLIFEIGIELKYLYYEQSISIIWNNSEFYKFFNLSKDINIENKLDSSFPIKEKPRGNDVNFVSVNDFIPLGIEDVYLNMSIKNFPYEIPNKKLGLFNASTFSINRFIDNDEYYYKEVVDAILTYLSKPENEPLTKEIIELSKNNSFKLKKDFFGNYSLSFDEYYIERRLIDVPEDSPLKVKHHIHKISFIAHNKSSVFESFDDAEIIALSFYFDENDTGQILYELKEIFGEDKNINILLPYSWEDRLRRLSYSVDSNSLHFADKSELKKLIDIMKHFYRYFMYVYEKNNLNIKDE